MGGGRVEEEREYKEFREFREFREMILNSKL